MRRLHTMTIGAVVLVAGLGAACSGDDTAEDVPSELAPTSAPTTEAPTPTRSPVERGDSDSGSPTVHFQLAAIDAGTRNLDSSDVAPYRQALDVATSRCNEDRQDVADMSVRAMQIAEENGTPSSILEMLRAIPEAVPPDMAPTSCSETFAAILTLMENG